MSKFPFRVIKNEAAKEANIFLYGIVGDYWYSDNPVTARSLQRQLTQLSDYKRINLRLNGPGGDIHEGLLMLNTIRADKDERIHTYNDGICASMMGVILCCVPIERRHAAKASLTMIHQASTLAWGNASDMRDTAEMLDKHDDVLAGVFSDALGLTIEDVKSKWFNGKDHWFTAEEGAAEGMFTVEDYEISDIPDNAANQPLDRVAAFYTKPSTNNLPSTIKNENTDMGILSNKFKTITALAKKPVAERTEADFQAVNDELKAEGLEGVTLVLDADLSETVEAAGKVPSLELKVTDLGNQIASLGSDKTVLAKKVTDLEAVVAAQKIELGKPAEELTPPITDANDAQPDGKKNSEPLTAQDKEQERLHYVSNLIP